MTTDNRSHQWETDLQDALQRRDAVALAAVLDEVHAADLATLYPDLDETEQATLLDVLSDVQAAELLDELEPEDRAGVLDLLSVERASQILEEMPADEAADLLAELPTKEADALLERMEPELADDVTELLRYPEDCAGGLMTTEFVRVMPDDTVADVLALLRRHHNDAEMIYDLFVLDEDDRLLGVVTLRDLIVNDPAVVMADIMNREVEEVPTAMPQREVAELVRRRDLLALPVVDDEGRMQGIVTVDDVGDVVEEEAADDLLELSGSEDHEEEDAASERRGWRSGLFALLGGLGASVLVWLFSRVLGNWAHVAVQLPLLLVLGLTISSQTTLAIDRAYESAVERHQLGRIISRELWTGVVLALIGSLLAGALMVALRKGLLVGIAVAWPMAAGLWVIAAASVATSLLLFRHREGLGPAFHALVITLALLGGVTVYLLMAQWTAGLVL